MSVDQHHSDALLSVVRNLAEYHREHEKYYAEMPLANAISLQWPAPGIGDLACSEAHGHEHRLDRTDLGLAGYHGAREFDCGLMLVMRRRRWAGRHRVFGTALCAVPQPADVDNGHRGTLWR